MNLFNKIFDWFMGGRQKDPFKEELEEIKKQAKVHVRETGSFRSMVNEIDARMKARQLKKLSLKELME